uniref:Uncharacterized protein n=1 Tax=Anguilla anguilla TaxID=7936 RepID=A0A0E9UT89_ANGAN
MVSDARCCVCLCVPCGQVPSYCTLHNIKEHRKQWSNNVKTSWQLPK